MGLLAAMETFLQRQNLERTNSELTNSELTGSELTGSELTKGELTRVEQAAERPASGVMLAAKCLTGDRIAMKPLLEEVTLVVYGWRNVQPGTLSWVFPSLGAAVAAAHAMRNAVQWAIVRGKKHEAVDVEAERATGSILVEQCE